MQSPNISTYPTISPAALKQHEMALRIRVFRIEPTAKHKRLTVTAEGSIHFELVLSQAYPLAAGLTQAQAKQRAKTLLKELHDNMEAGKSKRDSTSPLDFPPDMPNLFHLQHLKLQNVEPVYSDGQVHPAKPKLVEYWKATFYHRMPVGKGTDGKTIYATTAGQYLSFTFKKIIHSLDAQLLPIYTAATRALQLPHGAVFDATTAVIYRLFGNVFLPVLRTTEGEVPMCEGAVRGEGRDADFKDFEIPQQYSGTFILLPKTGAFMSPEKKEEIIKRGIPDMGDQYQDIFSQGLNKNISVYSATIQEKITQLNDLLKKLMNVKIEDFPLFVYIPDNEILGLIIMPVETFKAKIPELIKDNMDLSIAQDKDKYYLTQLAKYTQKYKKEELFISYSSFEDLFRLESEASVVGEERSGIIYSIPYSKSKNVQSHFLSTTKRTTKPNNDSLVTDLKDEVQPDFWRKKTYNKDFNWEVNWERFPTPIGFPPEYKEELPNYLRKHKVICTHSHHLHSPGPSGSDIKNYEGGDPILRISKDSWCHFITSTLSVPKGGRLVSIGENYRQLAIIFSTKKQPNFDDNEPNYDNEPIQNWEDTPNYHDFDQTQMLTLFFKDITEYVFLIPQI